MGSEMCIRDSEGTVRLDRNFTLLCGIWNEGFRIMNVVDAVVRLLPSSHEAWARFPVSSSCGFILFLERFFPGYSGFPLD